MGHERVDYGDDHPSSNTVEVEEALVDDVLVNGPLVLDDDGRPVLVYAQGVFLPVEYCKARNLTPSNTWRCLSMRTWRLFSTATNLP